MSQSGVLNTGSSGFPVEFIAGNSGGNVPPNGSGVITFTGSNATGINIVGTPGTNSLLASGIAASQVQVGTLRFATNAEADAVTDATIGISPSTLGYTLARPPAIGSVTPNAATFLALTANGLFTTLGGMIFKGIAIIAADYVVNTTDYYLIVTSTAAPRTITLPAAPTNGTTFELKDASNAAATNNITIVVSGGAAIEFSTSYIINENGGAVKLVYISSTSSYYVM